MLHLPTLLLTRRMLTAESFEKKLKWSCTTSWHWRGDCEGSLFWVPRGFNSFLSLQICFGAARDLLTNTNP